MTQHTIDPKKLADRIDAETSICKDGKKFVKELVALLTGVELEPAKPQVIPRKGQVWLMNDVPLLLTDEDGNIFVKTGTKGAWTHEQVAEHCTFAADSLADYLAQGGSI